MDPHNSGIPLHEWLSIALAGTVIIHLLLNWDWIVQVTARMFSKGLNGARMNYLINWLLFVDGILIMLSGIMISEAAAPALGFSLPEDFAWRRLHDMSANLSLGLMGLHLALHWNWIVATLKKLFKREQKQNVPALMERKDAQA